MSVLYEIFINIYGLLIFIASSFDNKAKKWIKGRRDLFTRLKNDFSNLDSPVLWFHASSLGEFEQGRPVIESIRKMYPEYKILLTFFSPSGYEIRKNYSGADFVYYMPLDTFCNAKKFLNITKPQKIFFIKYEFWYNYLRIAYKMNIPIYLISGIFRKNQLFFKWYGKFYKNFLNFFTTFFVQDENSAFLLKKIGFKNVIVSGDTRFDRVYDIAINAKENQIVQKFCENKFTIVCGSTWPDDEKILTKFINKSNNDFKFIVAPHEITNKHINDILQSIKKPTLLYSEANNLVNDLNKYSVLIINNIGMLSSLYRYGNLAYVGGGFGNGIHNILEAAVYGIPVVIGPNHKKFKEALELIELKGVFSINDYESFENIINCFYENKELLQKSGNVAKNYIIHNLGATEQIVSEIFKN